MRGATVAKNRQYDLEDRLLMYAAAIIRLTGHLSEGKAAAHVGGQLLRSATSPLSNHAEAQAAESPQDFVHKLKICLKELRESKRWLLLIRSVPLVTSPGAVDATLHETEELIRIFVASIKTSEKRRLMPATDEMV
jgi:four helix bundle protein